MSDNRVAYDGHHFVNQWGTPDGAAVVAGVLPGGGPKEVSVDSSGRINIANTISKYVFAQQILAAAGDYAANDVMNSNATTGVVWVWENIAPEGGGNIWI